MLLLVAPQLAAQRMSMADLPPGLHWSDAAVDSTGQVAFLLSSASEGTYFVQGDSARRVSPLRYDYLSPTPAGWQLSPPAVARSGYLVDSLLLPGADALVGLPTERPVATAGVKTLEDGRSVYAEQNRQIWSPNDGNLPAYAGVVRSGQSRVLTPSTSLQLRVLGEETPGSIVIDHVGAAVGATHFAIADRTAAFDYVHPTGAASRVVSLATLGLSTGIGQRRYTELSSAPVDLAALGDNFVLVAERELVLLDTAMREIRLARWPLDVPLGSAASTNDQLLLLDPAGDDRGRLSVLDASFDVLAQYQPASAGDTLQRVSVDRASQRVFLSGREGGVYANTEVIGGDFGAAGLRLVASPRPVLAKADYPLPDTLPRVASYRRKLQIANREQGPLAYARVLTDSSLLLRFDQWTEVRGASGQWRANWTADTTELATHRLPFGSFSADSTGVLYGGAAGPESILPNSTFASYLLYGSPAPGFALIARNETPFRGERTTSYRVHDSTGRALIRLAANLRTLNTRARIHETGLLLSARYTSYGTGRTPTGVDVVEFTPTTLLGPPTGLGGVACAIGDTVALTWAPDGAAATFAYDGAGYYTGQYYGEYYAVPTPSALDFEAAVARLDVRPVCGALEAGRVAVDLDGSHPPVAVRIDGLLATERAYDRYAQAEIVLEDSAGCQARRTTGVRELDFEPRIFAPCAGEPYGRVALATSYDDEGYLTFDDGTYRDARDSLAAGSYQVQLTSALGCAYDTLLAIVEAPPALPTLDTTARGSTYDVRAVDPDGDHRYWYAWSNGASGPSATLAAGATHSVYATQRSIANPQQVCSDTLRFTLGDGVSATTHPLLRELRVWVNGHDELSMSGLEALLRADASARVTLHDVNGRTLMATPVTGPTMLLRRGDWPEGIVYVRLGAYGTAVVFW